MPSTSVFEKLPRGTGNISQQRGPSASFLTPEEILSDKDLKLNPGNTDGKLFLGVVEAEIQDFERKDGTTEKIALRGEPIAIRDDRHVLTVAGSRAGKSRTTIIPNLVMYPGSVLAIDPKGDLATDTADWRADMLGQKVVVLDPFDAASDLDGRYRAGFNPITILKEDSPTILEDAGLIADALIIPSPGSQDPHWDESAKQFLEGVILHIATHENYVDHCNLATVFGVLMKDIDKLDGLHGEMLENVSLNFAIHEIATAYFQKAEKERSSILSSLRRHIRFLGYPQMQSTLINHSFDLEELKTGNLTVYLTLPAMRMNTCSRWLRLFVNLTLAAMESVKKKPDIPVLMCLDEFAVLGKMEKVEDAAGQIAGLGCKLWPILQDLTQLKALYGDRWETFIGNSGILQFFGNSDLFTLEWISKRLGQTTIYTSSQSQQAYKQTAEQGTTGKSFGEHVHPLMTAEEASRFFGRDDPVQRQLIIRPTVGNMILQRACHDKHSIFDHYNDFKQAQSNPMEPPSVPSSDHAPVKKGLFRNLLSRKKST